MRRNTALFEHAANHNLNQAEPLPVVHRAEIIRKGQVIARLFGDDLDSLRTRARTFADTQNADPVIYEA